MSYDLAVWENVPPFSTLDAAEAYEAVADHVDADVVQPQTPSPVIRAFVEALVDRWPQPEQRGDGGSPWSAGPLLANASGACIYLCLTLDGADTAVPVIAAIAKERGLVCYDPQLEMVI